MSRPLCLKVAILRTFVESKRIIVADAKLERPTDNEAQSGPQNTHSYYKIVVEYHTPSSEQTTHGTYTPCFLRTTLRASRPSSSLGQCAYPLSDIMFRLDSLYRSWSEGLGPVQNPIS